MLKKSNKFRASLLCAIALVCLAAIPAAAQEPQKADEPAKPNDKPAAPKRPLRADRLDLDTTVVTGNRELPKVLYIVPWKKAELGELPAQPFNTLLDEVLQPVDRDVFRRQVNYFYTIQSGADKSAATPAAAPAR